MKKCAPPVLKAGSSGILFFSLRKNFKPFYLGNSQLEINNLLQNVQYPRDNPRLQRHFKDFKHYKANEIRTFILNS